MLPSHSPYQLAYLITWITVLEQDVSCHKSRIISTYLQSPACLYILLEELGNLEDAPEYLLAKDVAQQPKPAPLSEAQFRWLHNQDTMATEKLAEGIRSFADAQEQLEARFKAM